MILYGASYVNDIIIYMIDDTQQHPTAYSIQYDKPQPPTSSFFILLCIFFYYLTRTTYNVQRTTVLQYIYI